MPKPNDSPAPPLPIIEALAPVRTGKGWVVVLIRVQGQRVLSQEVLTEPEPKAYAIEALKIQFARRWIVPSGGLS